MEAANLAVLREKVARFLDEVATDDAGREEWWLAFLRECKDIKGRPCSRFLAILRVTAATVKPLMRRGRKAALLWDVMDLVENTERELIEREHLEPEELDGDFLFGCENQITTMLRRELTEKEAVIAEKEAVIAKKEAVIAEKDSRLAEKERIIADLREKLGEQAEER